MTSPTLPFFVLYLAAVLAVGFFSRRRASRDEISYFVADRSLGTFWGFVGLASLTTGGSTTIVLATFVFVHGLSGLWLDLAGVLGLTVLGFCLAGRVRRENAVTLPEIVGRYYGAQARWICALLVLTSEIVWFALLIEATQVVLTSAFGMQPLGAIVASTGVFVLYTSLGGQFAVVRTDLIQYGLMLVGIPGLALAGALSHFAALRSLPREAWSFPVGPGLSGGDVVALLVLVGLPHLVGSDVYLKLLSCRDEVTARRAALLAAGSKLLFGLSVGFIALVARAALPPGPPGLTLPRAITAFLSPAAASLVLVSLVATMQTSADIVLLSASAVTARDLVRPLTTAPLPLSLTRCLPLLYGTLGLLVALAMDRNVVETLKLGYSIFAAGLILPTLVALLPRSLKIPPAAAPVAMVAGGVLAAAGRFWPAPFGRVDPVLVGTAVNAAVLFTAPLARWVSRAVGGR